jgi:hypothetical protein
MIETEIFFEGVLIDSNIVVFLIMGLSPILLMAAIMCVMGGAKPEPLAWAGPKPSQPLLVPTAEETAESIQRFHEAAERSEMVDFIWERYSKGRAILLDDIRQIAKRGKRRGLRNSRPRVPPWL